MKKIIKKIVFVTMVTIFMYLPQQTAVTTAETISVLAENVPTIGQCAEIGQKNTYEFIMPSSGYVQFQIRNVDYDKQRTEGWLINFFNSSAKEIDSFQSDDSKEVSSSVRYNLKKGTKIILEVDNKYYTSCDFQYELTPIVTHTTSWESESNDTPNQATNLAFGKARCGTKYKAGDEDYYVFTATKNGTVKCSLSIASALKEKLDSGESLTDEFRMAVLDNKCSELNSKDASSNTSLLISVKRGHKYYIKISTLGNVSSIDVLYKVRVAYKK